MNDIIINKNNIGYSISSISIIGAGNMGFRLGIALAEAGFEIKAIQNRSKENGEKLVRALNKNGQNTRYIEEIKELPISDLIIIAVSDDAIQKITKEIQGAEFNKERIIVHTSGSTNIDNFKDLGHEYGVIYPLMTLNKGKNINFKLVPFLLEASNIETENKLSLIPQKLGAEYKLSNSEERLKMHTAAVFSCNFVEYILAMAFEVIKENPIFLLPATIETVRKFFLTLDPEQTITGPARRGDMTTINKHLILLEKLDMPEHKEVYKFLSNKISEKYNKTKKYETK